MASATLLSPALLLLLAAAASAARIYPEQFLNQVRTFPNIMRNQDRCLSSAQRGTSSGAIYVCDPNGLLRVEDVKVLHTMLSDIRRTLNQDANVCDQNRPRPTIAIAVIQKMLIENGASFDSILYYASVFTYQLYSSWRLITQCESSKIIIFYSQDDGVLYTYAGEQLNKVLPTSKIVDTAVEAKKAFADGIKNGLMYVLDQYRMACQKGKR